MFTNALLDVTRASFVGDGIPKSNIEAWNARTETFIRVITQAYKWNVISEDKKTMQSVHVKDVNIVRPMSDTEGIMRHRTAFEEGSLTCKVFATMVYEVYAYDEKAVEEEKHLQDNEPDGFYFEIRQNKLEQSYYRILLNQHCSAKKIHIGNLPCMMWTDFDHQSTVWHDPTTSHHENLAHPFFIESRHLYTIPIQDNFKTDCIQVYNDECKVLSNFYNHERQGRTNWTLITRVHRQSFHSNSSMPKQWTNWNQRKRFVFDIPRESKSIHVPLMVLALAYGAEPKQFAEMIRMFIPPAMKDHKVTNHLLDIIIHDTDNCDSQADALIRLSEKTRSASKNNLADTRRDKITYMSFALRHEYLPGQNFPDEDLPDYFVDREAFRKKVELENVRKSIMVARVCAELICNTPEFKHVHPWDVKSQRDLRKRSAILPANRILMVLRQEVTHLAQKKLKRRMEKLMKKNKNLSMLQWYDIITNKFDIGEKIPSGKIVSKQSQRFDKSNKKANQTYSQPVDCGLNRKGFEVQELYTTKVKRATPAALMRSCQPHPTEMGREGAFNTPESEACGVRRSKTIGSRISYYIDDYTLEVITINALLSYKKFQPVTKTIGPLLHKMKQWIPVFNTRDIMCGWVDNAYKFYQYMRILRQNGVLPFTMSIAYDKQRNIFRLDASEGRLLIPFVTASNLKRTMQKIESTPLLICTNAMDELVLKGCIEYIDAAEEYSGFVRIAQDIDDFVESKGQFSHMSLPLLNYAPQVLAAHCTENLGTRIMFAANHRKGAMEMRNYNHEGCTQNFRLWHAEKSLVGDQLTMLSQFEQTTPMSNHVVVAFMCREDNIEDSFTVKQSAIDRGLAISTKYHTIQEIKDRRVRYAFPDNRVVNMQPIMKYYHTRNGKRVPISPNGMPVPGVIIQPGQVLISRSFKMSQIEDTFLDISRINTFDKAVRVEEVVNKGDFVQLVVSYVCTPVSGNKGYFPFGHKGTFTVRPDIDLPFIVDTGIIPDVIVSAMGAFRQTGGMWRSGLEGIVRALEPDALNDYETLFNSADTNAERLKIMENVLKKHGYPTDGRVYMRDGETGLPIRSPVFIAILPLHIVKHMAPAKMSARARVGRTEEGRVARSRSKQGAVKISSYAQKSITSSGVNGLLKELQAGSEPLDTYYHCTRCQSRATGHYSSPQGYHCPQCGAGPSDGVICIIELSYWALYFMEGLRAAGINLKLKAEMKHKDEIGFQNDSQLVQKEILKQLDNLNLLTD